jgi:hypothetical protein
MAHDHRVRSRIAMVLPSAMSKCWGLVWLAACGATIDASRREALDAERGVAARG